MKEHRILPLFVMAFFSGIFLGVMYVNPFNGEITLSELILQLSGSRGEFALGFSLTDLVSFAMRMIPSYLFEMYFGIALYRHFCTASIYVFSRYPRRVRWYFGELFYVGGSACLFEFLLLGTSILVTIVRYRLIVDQAGILLTVYHFLIYSIWTYSLTVIVNILALWNGSSKAYMVVAGIQIVCVSLLICGNNLISHHEGKALFMCLVKLNPVTHLVLGWHSSSSEIVNQVLSSPNSPHLGINLNDSLAGCAVFCLAVTMLGAMIIKRHDILISDLEMGAV